MIPLGLFAAYVAVLIATYLMQHNWWMTCPDEQDAWSNAILTWPVSGLLLAGAVACAKFRPTWLWITSFIAALPIGYIICGIVLLAPSSGTPNACGG